MSHIAKELQERLVEVDRRWQRRERDRRPRGLRLDLGPVLSREVALRGTAPPGLNALATQGLDAVMPEMDRETAFSVDLARGPHTVARLGIERVLAKSDLIGFGFLEEGWRLGRAVGRIRVRNSIGTVLGYGTGFLISPQLVLTNNYLSMMCAA